MRIRSVGDRPSFLRILAVIGTGAAALTLVLFVVYLHLRVASLEDRIGGEAQAAASQTAAAEPAADRASSDGAAHGREASDEAGDRAVAHEAPGEGAGNGDGESEGRMLARAVEAVEQLTEKRNAERARRLFESLASAGGRRSLPAVTGLEFRSEGPLRGSLRRDGNTYFDLAAREARGAVKIESVAGKSRTVSGTERDPSSPGPGAPGSGQPSSGSSRAGDSVAVDTAPRNPAQRSPEQSLSAFMAAETERLEGLFARRARLRERLQRLPERAPVSDAMRELDLESTRIIADDFVLRMGFATSSGAVILRVAADAKKEEIRLEGDALDDSQELASAVASSLRNYDPQEALAETKRRLEQRFSRLRSDEGFREFLRARGLSLGRAREAGPADGEPPVLRYPLYDDAGKTAAHIVLDPGDGTIRVKEAGRPSAEETPERWLLAQVPTTYYEPDRGSAAASKRVTFLLLGEKDGLSDSIMLIRAGPEEIAGIGVPRDTYWKGLKLNQLYHAEGARALARAVTEITGIAIDHRIRVGMEGFAEMIRAFGTIRVDVQEEIVDPTMTYRVDGNKRMLYLPPGTHELNAAGVLAFARSRRTSSDFDRAERQLQIVQGLRRRMEEVALTDAGRLYELLRSVLGHTRSNVTFDEALDYVRRFRGVEDTRHIVLSTDNVFSSTYERLFEEDRPLADAAEMESEDLGGWILRPKQQDWELVRWYAGEWLSGAKPDVETYLSRRYPVAYAIPSDPLKTLQMTEQGLGFRWLDRLLSGTLWQSAEPTGL